ncbi:16S rRNA (cytidine(1402)-2'-O)-methyltransferase [Enterococcus sp. LJL120]
MNKQKSFQQGQVAGTLYLVPTPIGNLEDMTFRAVKTLGNADLIASEDTRNTQKLLNHFDLQTPQKSLHEHNYRERIPYLLEFLKSGKDVAQVSDAGMPSISDPGHELVKSCLAENISVVALPGPTAGVTALIASGLNPQPFTFYGFLTRKKKDQVAFLEEILEESTTSIFYESPHRIKATIDILLEVFGEREAVICRELTKIHEEYLRGSLAELQTYLAETELKGEICLLVAGFTGEKTIALPEGTLKEQVAALIENGLTTKDAIKETARRNDLKKQIVYNAYHELNEN